MAKIISDLFSKIQPDPWRKDVGFSKDLEETHQNLSEAGNNEEKIIEALSKWLQRYQPCLFGRLAARLNMLSYCILTEDDLRGDDETIQDTIQRARTKWTAEGFKGQKSGFILFIASPTIAYSIPNEVLMSLTKQLCSLYLLEDIKQDVIYTDEIFLEKPGPSQTTWKWLAGVNYFCSNADNRWWQDHRIPGGLAFSVNSVGHMARAGGIAKVMNELNRMVGVNEEGFTESKVDSLDQALEFAMRTISMASESISGKATELIPINGADTKPSCPITLPKQLTGKDHRSYKGYYHTDVTIPSEYFTPDVSRKDACEIHDLDFTYLYHNDLSNPDYIKMGTGRVIRSYTSKQVASLSSNPKRLLVQPIEEEIIPESRLHKIINGEIPF
jgi:hypothetical protein